MLKCSPKFHHMANECFVCHRWVCKHYGMPKASQVVKNKGVRKNQSILPCECKMQILISYNNYVQAYVVKTSKLEHNHAIGEPEYNLYATARRPQGQLRETVETLLQNGANPTLVTNYLNANNARVKPRDVYNIRQKLNFRGEQLFSSNTSVTFSLIIHLLVDQLCQH